MIADPMIDLAGELAAALANVRPAHRTRLADLGVPPFVLSRELALVGVERVEIEGDTYQPHPGGSPAVIVAVRVPHGMAPGDLDHPAPQAAALVGEQVVDIIAFAPDAPDRFATRLGIAECLGFLAPPFLKPPPTRVHAAPLDWLRAEGKGIAIVAREATSIRRVLMAAAPGGIEVRHAAFARTLRRIAERPWPAPRITVARERHA